MIKTQISIRAYLALSVGCLLLSTVPASALTRQEIIEAWQKQINSIQSLQFDCDSFFDDFTDSSGVVKPKVFKQNFALSGDKYCSYIKFSGVGDFAAMASAYDGDYYQKLMDEKGTVTVYKTKKKDTTEQIYLGLNLLTIPYQFAFMPGDPPSIETLKKSQTWERLSQRIIAIWPSTHNGKPGFTIDIAAPVGNNIYHVSVDEETLQPYHYSVGYKIPQEIDANEEVIEMNINTFASGEEKDASLRFPTQITLRTTRGRQNERLISQVSINVVPESLKINEPVPDDIFTLTPPNAIFVDVEEQERIYEERKKFEKLFPVGQPLPTVKIGDEAPEFSFDDCNGKKWNLAELRGRKNVLLTFFPNCYSGRCSNQLSSLRDVYPQLQAADVEILAVSVDPAKGDKGQQELARRAGLVFPMLPDTQRVLSMLYGAAQAENQRAARMTLLIDIGGIVRFVDTNVNVQTHGADVLAKLRELKIIE
jgi:peroxiredoxin (alkyl hydroperoxide reductase subunit C)